MIYIQKIDGIDSNKQLVGSGPNYNPFKKHQARDSNPVRGSGQITILVTQSGGGPIEGDVAVHARDGSHQWLELLMSSLDSNSLANLFLCVQAKHIDRFVHKVIISLSLSLSSVTHLAPLSLLSLYNLILLFTRG